MCSLHEVDGGDALLSTRVRSPIRLSVRTFQITYWTVKNKIWYEC